MRWFTLSVAASAFLILAGCLLPPKTTVPMEVTWIEQETGLRSDTLFVFLPGRRNQPADFIDNGFIAALREAGISGDAVLPNAHLGYYYERNFSERLVADVIEPARARGYSRIWAVGISLGGFGAVMFERDHPGTWDGIVLIAPFVGDQKTVLEQVYAAGSLNDVPFPSPPGKDDYTAKFWMWMRDHAADPGFPMLITYGTSDYMATGQSRIASLLPQDHVLTGPGGHNWKVWSGLWEELLHAHRAVLLQASPLREESR